MAMTDWLPGKWQLADDDWDFLRFCPPKNTYMLGSRFAGCLGENRLTSERLATLETSPLARIFLGNMGTWLERHDADELCLGIPAMMVAFHVNVRLRRAACIILACQRALEFFKIRGNTWEKAQFAYLIWKLSAEDGAEFRLLNRNGCTNYNEPRLSEVDKSYHVVIDRCLDPTGNLPLRYRGVEVVDQGVIVTYQSGSLELY